MHARISLACVYSLIFCGKKGNFPPSDINGCSVQLYGVSKVTPIPVFIKQRSHSPKRSFRAPFRSHDFYVVIIFGVIQLEPPVPIWAALSAYTGLTVHLRSRKQDDAQTLTARLVNSRPRWPPFGVIKKTKGVNFSAFILDTWSAGKTAKMHTVHPLLLD